MTTDPLLETFHRQIRLADRDAEAGLVVDRDGPVHRHYPPDSSQRGAMIESPEGLGDDPDAVIAAQRDFFVGRGQAVEWKTYSYDEPADLGARLTAAGFEAQEAEALILGDLDVLAGLDQSVPPGLRLRAIVADDLPAVTAFNDRVWGADKSWVTGRHFEELVADPDHMQGCLVEQADDGLVVTASWVRLTAGTDFCGLWGGSTLPEFRRRGLYRAGVGYRARLALARGAPHVRVDASPNSRPILQRLGLRQVATTTPYVLEPSTGLPAVQLRADTAVPPADRHGRIGGDATDESKETSHAHRHP